MIDIDREEAILNLAKTIQADATKPAVSAVENATPLPEYAIDPALATADPAAKAVIDGLNKARADAFNAFTAARMNADNTYNGAISSLCMGAVSALEKLVGTELSAG